MLLPKKERSHAYAEGQARHHSLARSGGEAIAFRECEGSSFRNPDAGSYSSRQGTTGEAVTWDYSTGSVGTAEN